MSKAKVTIDHATIRAWVEERGGCPAHVKGTGSADDPGILRIDYTGFSGTKSLEGISWDEFFAAFDANELAFLYQDEDDSRFSKLVSRDSVDLDEVEVETGGKAEGPDAIDLLMGQHREVEELFEKLEAAKSDSQKQRVFLEIANALAAHSKIEETIFYPSVFDDETEQELRESVEEHLVMKRILADLLDMEPSDPQYMSKVTVLKEVVLHHVEEEENKLFPQVREDEMEDLELLGKRMERRYQELMQGEPADEVPAETDHAAIAF